MKVALAVLLVALATLIPSSQTHSWVACTDYEEENGVLWDATKCHGYPRGWGKNSAVSGPFGLDTGFNSQLPNFQCRDQYLDENNYSGQYPAAEYDPGQKVCVAWPPKNHIAAICNNAYIPDGGTQIWYTSSAGDTDWKLLVDWGAFQPPATDNPSDKPRKGYQNCPNFCADNDKALCTGCFTAPNTPGTYSFQWRWIFNPGDPYITCWEATVGSKSSSTPVSVPITPPVTPPVTQPVSQPTTEPVSVPTNPPVTSVSSNTQSDSLAQGSWMDSLSSGGSVIALLVIVLLLLVVVAVLLIVGLLVLKKKMGDL